MRDCDSFDGDVIEAGTRVEIRARVLEPEERADGLPPDTARLPYELRARGLLVQPCLVGDQATIRTATGRLLRGSLESVEPADTHTFGRPPRALVEVVERIGCIRDELS